MKLSNAQDSILKDNSGHQRNDTVEENPSEKDYLFELKRSMQLADF